MNGSASRPDSLRSRRAAIVAVVVSAIGAVAVVVWRASRTVVDPEPVPARYAALRPPSKTIDTTTAERLFLDNCAPCHDDRGTGHGPGSEGLTVPPAALSSAGFLAARSDAYLFWRISEGKPGTAMPSFQHTLSTEERWALIAWLRANLQR